MENSVVCVASCQSVGNSEDQSVMSHPLVNQDLELKMSPEDAPSVSPLTGVEGDSVPVREPGNEGYTTGKESLECPNDVERFDGKIVYNPDGSAYIIEGDDEDLEEEVKVIPKLEGCIVVDSKADIKTSQVPAYPQIANAIYVTKNPSFYSGLYGQSFVNTVEKKKKLSEAPVMHSFRVYTTRGKDRKEAQKNGEVDRKPMSIVDYNSVPIKPILMCFICKLSFGYVKSFVAHAMNDHSIKLAEEEKDILGHKNCSAIIQCVGKEKETLISFLEPVAPYISASDSLEGTLQKTVLPPAGSSSLSVVNSFYESSNSNPVSSCETDNAVKLFSPTAVPNTQVNRTQALGPPSDRSPDRLPPRSSPSQTPTDSNMQSFSHRSKEGLDLSLKNTNGESLVMSKTPPVTSTGTTIGACPEHISGRPTGAECANCDLILSSSQSLAGQMALQMSSRNSCKTLKCPKCNWHYKYQETLEIHMKEKHPENETSCIYCITNQPHPRLARGESYTCGYKPYRCEVCNYSTTTKGNLSIHMQSDKHLNNMQELQNGGVPTPSSVAPTSESPSTPLHPNSSPSPVSQKPKPKPTWRCDVCNYETNVARNLRIHMTSEKHTHNMMVLQQNVKQMQQMSAFHAQNQGGFDPSSMLSFMPGVTFPGEKPPPHTEAALADMAYNQALFIQMLTSGQMSPQMHNELLNSMNEITYNHENSGNDLMDTIEPNPKHLFQCCVCCVFSADSVDALNIHMSQDRTKTREQEILMLVTGNYICKLCNYKTNLKANFQLHCKTDKHLQRLQHINHIKEGGPLNEWRLKYMNLSNPVQVRCNACDFYTNSTHKLQVHVTNQQHEIGAMLFWHLRKMETSVSDDNRFYHCTLCNFSSQAKMHLIKHVRSMKHLQMENLHQLKRRSEGIDIPEDIGEIFQVRCREETENTSDVSEPIEKRHMASPENSKEEEQKISSKKESMDSDDTKHSGEVEMSSSLSCPLCQERCADRSQLEEHATQIHNVTSEGLNRLLLLIEPGIQQNNPSNSESKDTKRPSEKSPSVKGPDEESLNEMEKNFDSEYQDDSLRCPTCTQSFRTTDELYSHQNELGHLEIKQTPRGLGYVCWKKGCNQYFPSAQNLQNHFTEVHATPHNLAVSEKHVYKYRCNQCSLAFKTMEKLQLHFQYHAIRDATKCVLCGRNFRSIHALYKHVETHSELSEAEIQQYKLSLMNNPFLLAGMSGQVLDPSTNDLLKKETNKEEDIEAEDPEMKETEDDTINEADSGSELPSTRTNEQQMIEDYLNSQAMAEDSYSDPGRKYKCHRCKVAFTRQSYLTSHNKTLLHRKGEKLSYPMEKYLDPNRPYKCEVCKESFTQKNILLVHYNSVSHLHKLKRSLQDQQQSPGASLPPSHSPNPSPSLGSPNSSLKEDDDKKPYKCNICKVAYSQGSTLDIHVRSVLHQTRAAKLQELASSGQLDLTKPLIEQPDPQKIQEQQKKFLQDILNTKPPPGGNVSSITIPVTDSYPEISVKSSPVIASPPVTATVNNTNSPNSSPSSTVTCQRCCATFTSPEELSQHQQLYCIFNSTLPVFSTLVSSGPLTSLAGGQPNNERTETSTEVEQDQSNVPKFNMPTRKSSHIYRHLLESYGFEVVMQFNEYNQKQIREQESDSDASELDKLDGFPELGKSVCPLCKKTFSSVWVLKAHREEVHGESIPIKFLEKFADAFKQDFDKKYPELKSDTDGNCDNNGDTSEPINEDRAYQVQQNETVTQYSDPYLNSPATSAVSDNPMPQVSTATSVASAQNNFLQQMSEMNSALSVMAASQMQQMQFNPMMMSLAGLGMGMPFGMNMQALAAMNLQPPLVPFMMPPPMGMDPLAAAALLHSQPGPMIPPSVDTKMLAHQKSAQHQQATPSQQKRARTRISDEQLKILRAHFDINNSPTEDQINDMAQKSGLPPKVIKHWFRNTLFKERQRNKDSPYNFSNPPCTTLNLEEYENSGDPKSTEKTQDQIEVNIETKPEIESKPIKQEPERGDFYPSAPLEQPIEKDTNDVKQNLNTEDKKTSIMKTPGCDTPQATPPYPNLPSLSVPSPMNMSLMTSASSTPDSSVQSHLFPHKMTHMFSNQMSGPSLLPPIPTSSATPSPSRSDITCSSGGVASGKRANRTRFTDYQIKVLQEFFENNAYPKDDDLEYLSKLLNLSPRVIVVWFQNARQKARKVYENQPPVDPNDEGSGRFQRTPGLNYQCKKCLLVFQRYYELIRHQKSHCFKEEDAKRSAQAQAAAAAAAAACSGQSQNHSHHLPNNGTYSDDSNSSSAAEISHSSNVSTDSKSAQEGNFQCDHCKLVFPRFDLWREHQIIHLMNPNLFPTYASGNMFGPLPCEPQALASMHGMETIRRESSSPKRKFSDDEEREDQPRDKRLRTTILPEQLDYLYQKYQVESNPSRKMLETIASEVGLTKRVVQVWFQNTRARERKGQFRAHAQVINKRCPFCPALFKVKSAFESHLAYKHPDQYSKGDINIDNLPDEPESENEGSSKEASQVSSNIPQHLTASYQPNETDQDILRRHYEETMKKFLIDLESSARGIKGVGEPDFPLDLSKPYDMAKPTNSHHDISFRHNDHKQDNDDNSESECSDMEGDNGLESNPTSPASSTQSHRLAMGGKRYRTQMSNVQVQVMKAIFQDYKTPAMSECEMLGKEVGLPKRVVQVWFQNARAKEKKYKLAVQKGFGQDGEDSKPSEECKLCNFRYSHKYSLQDHLFSKGHIDSLRGLFDKGKSEDGHAKSDTAALQNQLQMMQHMATAAGLNLPPGLDVKDLSSTMATTNGLPSTSLTSAPSSAPSQNDTERMLMQMYGMSVQGYGGMVPSNNPLVQAMYSGQPGLLPEKHYVKSLSIQCD